MSLLSEWIRYGDNNQYSGYVAKPQRISEPLSVVLVIQEIWGVDAHIQNIAERFAQAGYIAFAPDLYAKDGSRPDDLSNDRVEQVKQFLDSLPPTAWGNQTEREEAIQKLSSPKREEVSTTLLTLFGGLKMDLYIEQLIQTTSFLRNQYPATKDKGVASVGFCMGGALSALLACHDKELKGAVIFYGNAPQSDLLSTIQCPVLGFYGELDPRITSAVPEFEARMKENGKSFEAHVYNGAHHAFFNDTRSSYNCIAARDAFARTLTFFNDVLS